MIQDLNTLKRECALKLLEMYKAANAGHIGASLSCLDLLIYLHKVACTSKEDVVILSKGHAAGALYVVLEKVGKLPAGSGDQFYKNGTDFAAHPPCNREYPAIPFGTGSLGHGVGLATGIALAAKLKSSSKKVFVIASDGELNEGSTWEALMFAQQHRLQNLCIVVDANGLQGLGSTKDILDLNSFDHPLEQKFKSFGVEVISLNDGHDFEEIHKAFERRSFSGLPTVIIVNTTKGSGVSYMEGKFEWHYLPMNDEQFTQAKDEVGKNHA